MGSCISKCCRPRKKKKSQEDHHVSTPVQDKLVITQDRVQVPKIPAEKPLSPAPSFSFSCSNTSTKCTVPSSSFSSSSSSCSSVKDHKSLFTNEFLWSCVKENPHIIGLNPAVNLKKPFDGNANKSSNQQSVDPSSFLDSSPMVSKVINRSLQQDKAATIIVPTPKKRARASSPTVVRQKSFRREQMPNSRVGHRSPSPSRRFNGDNNRSISAYESPSRRQTMNGANCTAKKESLRSPRRDNNLMMMKSCNNFDPARRISKEQVFPQRVSAKIEESGSIGDAKCSQEMDDDVVMEDINNPLIALDCFIFL